MNKIKFLLCFALLVVGVEGRGQIYINSYRFAAGDYIAVDTNAIRFLDSAGITDLTIRRAVDSLVISLKNDGIWSKMDAIYPFVGGTESAHKWNLKDVRNVDAAFRLVFSGGWTHAATGALPNGTSGYADTKYNPSTQSLSTSSAHISLFQRGTSDSGSSRCKIGATDNATILTNGFLLAFYSSGTVEIGMVAGASFATYTPSGSSPASQGLFVITTNGDRNAQHYINGATNGSAVDQGAGAMPGRNLFIGAENRVDTAASFYNKEIAFASIGDGLSATDVTNLNNAVSRFQTILNRNN